MAASEEFTVSSENLLVCPICMDIFTKPKSLMPCLHTFCEKCLCGYLGATGTAIWLPSKNGVRQFKCPTCRGAVSIPEGAKKSPTGWAAAFRGNHIIQSLLDERKRSTSTRPMTHAQGKVNFTAQTAKSSHPPDLSQQSPQQLVTSTDEVRDRPKETRRNDIEDEEVEERRNDLDQETLERFSSYNPAETRNPVSVFMEFGQKVYRKASFIPVNQTNSSHVPVFKMAACLLEEQFPAATGPSKAVAKQRAACVAMNIIMTEEGTILHAVLSRMLGMCKTHPKQVPQSVRSQAENSAQATEVIPPVRTNTDTCVAPRTGIEIVVPPDKNPVSLLNEYCQAKQIQLSFEVLSKSGPSHLPQFVMCAVLDGYQYPSVAVKSKKDGKTLAALKVLEVLNGSTSSDSNATNNDSLKQPLDTAQNTENTTEESITEIRTGVENLVI